MLSIFHIFICNFLRTSYRQMYRKFKKVALRLLVHVTPSIFFNRILWREALVYKNINYILIRTAVLRKLFDIRFSYKHCNFSCVCLLVKMASKTVTRSIIVKLKPTDFLTPKKLTKALGLSLQAWKSWITLCSLQVFLFFSSLGTEQQQSYSAIY